MKKKVDRATAAVTSPATPEALRERVTRLDRRNRILAVVAAFAVVGALALPGYRLVSASSARSTCLAQEQQVEELAAKFKADDRYLDFPNFYQELYPEDGAVPECPRGGDYSWDPVTGRLDCSEHGHY